MTRTAEEVFNALESAGADVRDDYSGRSMYGTRCPAFYHEKPAIAFEIFVRLGEIDAQLAVELARTARTDSMGRGSIVYWPAITYATDQ